jgi:hypothetical protein
MIRSSLRLVAAAIAALTVSRVSAAVVNFNGISFQNLPYTEAGLTFTNMPGTDPAVIAGGADGHLVAGTNGTPIHVRVTGSQPFDLVTLDIENMFRTWRIESSAGAVFHPTTAGTVDFTGLTGWTNLTSFDVVHNPTAANGTIRVDNVVFAFVPEPTAGSLIGLAIMLVSLRRWRA